MKPVNNKLRHKYLLLLIPIFLWAIIETSFHYFESKTQKPLWTNLFCDDVHLTLDGHKIVAKYISLKLIPIITELKEKNENLRIAVFGGSVSGGNCSPGKTLDQTWVDFLSKDIPSNVSINNYSTSGANSDHSVIKIKEVISRRDFFDLAIITDFGNEFDLKGNRTDRNFHKLKTISPLYERPLVSPSAFRSLFISIHTTLHKISPFYRFLSHFFSIADILPTSIKDRLTFLTVLKENPDAIKILSSRTHLNLSIENYLINLYDIKTLSSQNNFSVLLLPLPTNELNAFKDNPNLQALFNRIYLTLRTEIMLKSQTLGFLSIDLTNDMSKHLNNEHVPVSLDSKQ